MVYAFILHTVGSKDVQVLYYKIYTCYGSLGHEISTENITKSDGENVTSKHSVDSVDFSKHSENKLQPKVLFESISDKKELISYISNKVHMNFSLKIKQALVPTSVGSDTKITGVFKERNWKQNSSEEFVVVWQGIRGFGFTLLCKKHENVYQAQNVLNILISQFEKQIKLLSEPLVAVKLIETVSLIVNNYLPGGQLLYFNSKMIKAFTKKVEIDLYAK